MKAVVVDKPGGHERLVLRDLPSAPLAASEVRIAVSAIGVNFADCVVRMGHYEAAKGKYPITPGFEFAGTVAEAGAAVTHVRQGQRVFGFTRFGAYASEVVVPEHQAYPIPEGWTEEEAAGIPAVFMTAWYALRRVARVEAGERILVHSAAGGVGIALCQLASLLRCEVVGVVGMEKKVDVAKRYGAAHVVVRSDNLWRDLERVAPDGFDVIFDSNGVRTVKEGYERLRRGGRVVVYGAADILPRGSDKPNLLGLAINYLKVPRFSPFGMTLENRGLLGFNVVFLFDKLDIIRRGMGELVSWMAEGKIHKVPVTTFALERVVDAHRAIESGTTVGKLILTVGAETR